MQLSMKTAVKPPETAALSLIWPQSTQKPQRSIAFLLVDLQTLANSFMICGPFPENRHVRIRPESLPSRGSPTVHDATTFPSSFGAGRI